MPATYHIAIASKSGNKDGCQSLGRGSIRRHERGWTSAWGAANAM